MFVGGEGILYGDKIGTLESIEDRPEAQRELGIARSSDWLPNPAIQAMRAATARALGRPTPGGKR